MTFAIHLLNGVQILNTELDPSKCNKYYIKVNIVPYSFCEVNIHDHVY
jgi:hypothetical protein